MGKKIRDISGVRFANLVAVKIQGKTSKGDMLWYCTCDCGKDTVARLYDLTGGNTKSCGCRKTPHSSSYTKEYRTWANMKTRCQFSKLYLKKGITVCEEWVKDFITFLNDMGFAPTPKHTLDRIDNSKGYYKDNCRWATILEQANNKDSNVFVEYNGQRLTLSQWGERIGIDGTALGARLRSGWDTERALTTPIRQNRKDLS